MLMHFCASGDNAFFCGTSSSKITSGLLLPCGCEEDGGGEVLSSLRSLPSRFFRLSIMLVVLR